jgi:hypothetical protein
MAFHLQRGAFLPAKDLDSYEEPEDIQHQREKIEKLEDENEGQHFVVASSACDAYGG